MKPTIFLDIDDVLAISREFTSYQVMATFESGDLDGRPELWNGLLCAEARQNLAALHDEFNPQYVISSSWSHYLACDQLRAVFHRCHLQFVAEGMHDTWTTPKCSGWSRFDEIHHLALHHLPRGCPMLVLDDELSGASLRGTSLYDDGLVVLCEPWVGLNADKLSEAQRLLRSQVV